jgi:hypothetical protein
MELLQKKTKILNNNLNTLRNIIKNNSLKIILLKKYKGLIPQGTIFLAFLFIYIIIGYFPKTIIGFSYITGDEPHYLIMTQSIANDGDFNLDNNYKLDLHKEFYNAYLQRHYIDIHGKNYSLHPFGLPIIMAPFYKLFGYKGVFLGMILFSCFGLVEVYNICKFFSNPRSAFVATFLLGLTVPVSIYLSSQFFPETIAFTLFACLISIALRLDFKNLKYSFMLILIVSIMLSLLHVKFTLLTFGAGLLSMIISLKNKLIKYAFIFWLLIGIMTIVTIYLILSITYDGHVLEALRKAARPGGHESAPSMTLKYVLRGVYLNFFEREKGIFWYMPILFIFLNPLYIYSIFRYRILNCKIQILGVFIANVPYLTAVFSFFDSLGGWCPPGRYLIPSMTFAAILLSLTIDIIPKWLLKLSIFITFICVLKPGIMYADPNSSFAFTVFYNSISDLVISQRMTDYATTVDVLSKVKFVGLLLGGMFAAVSYEMITKIFTSISVTANEERFIYRVPHDG